MNSSKLVYLIGASGAGKDTLLLHVRDEINYKQLPVVFAHRYITRPVEQFGENHICLTKSEFEFREKKGLFAMHWKSHGNYYGIGREIDEWLELNNVVVMNGSRGYIPQALERYPDMNLCLILTSYGKLKERLINRGRETNEEIEERLIRASEFNVDYPNTIRINNDGPIESTKKQFIDVLQNIIINNYKFECQQ